MDAIISYNGHSESHDFCPRSFADLTIECEVRSGLVCKDKCRSSYTGGNLKYEDNGICEDAGDGGGLLAGICPAGYDCSDCGPSDVSGLASSLPTSASFAKAKEYACTLSDGGVQCSGLIKEALQRFWGEGLDVVASLASTCSTESTCVLPGLYNNYRIMDYTYTLPSSSSEGSEACCKAAEVIISYYRAQLRPGKKELGLFACPAGNDVLEVSCTDGHVCENTCGVLSGNGICDDGGDGSEYAVCYGGSDCADCGVRGQAPDASTFERALRLMCAVPHCAAFVEDVIGNEEHLRGKWVALKDPITHYYRGALGLHGYLDVGRFCLSPDTAMCLVGSLYFIGPAESVARPVHPFAMTCCRAARIFWGDLAWQGVATPGIQSACDSEPCDANGRVEAEIVASAKAWIRQSPECLSTMRRVMQQEQNRTAFVEEEEGAATHPRHHFFQGISMDVLGSLLEEEYSCWLRYAPTTPLFGVPPLLCAAFDVWLSRTMWERSPTLATRFYDTCVVPSVTRNATTGAFEISVKEACGSPFDGLPRPREASFIHARDCLCASWQTRASGPDGGSLHFARLQEHVQRLGLPDMYFPEQVCADPCRCSSRIPEALGCKIHDGEVLLRKGRAYCFVAEPEACTEGVTSPDHEGEVEP